jgi:hypothetical protein
VLARFGSQFLGSWALGVDLRKGKRSSLYAWLPAASDLARRRLINQRLVGAGFRTPAEAVSWFGAVQSQDYAGAKWALGQRMQGASDAALDRAFDAGEILRTHVLRPTWHFVAPADIRWMLALTGPRVQRAMSYYCRQNGLDAKTFARARPAIQRALKGGTHLTRAELAAALKKAGIDAQGVRLGLLVMHEETDGIISQRPAAREAVHLRAGRARSAGATSRATRHWRHCALLHEPRPATVRDFVWWSGLTVKDARSGTRWPARRWRRKRLTASRTGRRRTSATRARSLARRPPAAELRRVPDCKDRGNVGHFPAPPDPRASRAGRFRASDAAGRANDRELAAQRRRRSGVELEVRRLPNSDERGRAALGDTAHGTRGS